MVRQTTAAALRSCAYVRAGARGLAALDDVIACAHPAMNREQQFGRSAVGTMNGECPAEMFGFGTQCGAVIGDKRLIIGAPKLCPTGRDAAEPLGLHEF